MGMSKLRKVQAQIERIKNSRAMQFDKDKVPVEFCPLVETAEGTVARDKDVGAKRFLSRVNRNRKGRERELERLETRLKMGSTKYRKSISKPKKEKVGGGQKKGKGKGKGK